MMNSPLSENRHIPRSVVKTSRDELDLPTIPNELGLPHLQIHKQETQTS